MPPCDFANSSLAFYQFFEGSNKRRLKEQILPDVDEMIKLGYGTYNEILELTFREIDDIKDVLLRKQQEAELSGSTQ